MNPTELADALQRQFDLTDYGQQPPELYDPIRYIMGLGGKRLRPLMTLLTAALFTDDWQGALKPAVAVEVFHNFTLMHDDIMDRAPLRRGQPTVHEKWDANIAILSGDVMLVRAYEQLFDVPPTQLRTVLTRFSQTAAGVCEGQQMDMNFETRDIFSNPVREEEYLEMIRLKTSVLLGFAMELGGLIAGADADSTQCLYDAGVNIGIGFQLKDDLLDVYGDPAKFGKQVGGDILANKKTFMLIEALERAEGDTRRQLLDWLEFDVASLDKSEKVMAVTRIYDQLGIRELAEQRMAEYIARAFANLEQVRADATRKAILHDFIYQLVERES